MAIDHFGIIHKSRIFVYVKSTHASSERRSFQSRRYSLIIFSNAHIKIGNILATAGDEGTIMLWVPTNTPITTLADDAEELALAKEYWKVKIVCRSMGSEIYDLCWSVDSNFLIAGAMDNSLRLYDAHTGMNWLLLLLAIFFF